ncbi:hydrolase [Catenulispora pinisilvae]|uniref:hydrolase n=1 Tax=Catenulispora pinisilvae TaxID=2705253 RepID=UPI001890EADB|nr:hydrolase [Catenulispora pinisilvae]
MAITTIDPKTALVVIDLQNGITAMPGDPVPTAEVIKNSVGLAEEFRARDLPVVLVNVTFAADGSDVMPGRADQSMSGHAFPEGWDQVIADLDGHDGDVRVTKRNWSAFYGTNLDLHLRRRGVTQIVLTGIATSIGVESTARFAHEHGYHVTIATDAVTDSSAEAHQNSVERIFPRLAETGTTAEIVTALPTA